MQPKYIRVLISLFTLIFAFVIAQCDSPTGGKEEGASPWKVYFIKELPKNQHILGIYMLSLVEGWACIGPEILKFNGEKWFVFQDFRESFAGPFWDIDFSGPDDGWVVGSKYVPGGGGVAIIHYDGEDWKDVSPEGVHDLYELYCVFAIAPDDVWAGGPSGLYHYDGSIWTHEPGPTQVWGLHFTSPTHGWAVATGGGYFRWDGGTWTQVFADDGEYRRGVFAPTPTTAWAVGGGFGFEIGPYYPIFRYNHTLNIWEKWREERLPKSLEAVHFAAPDDGWVVGQFVARYDGQNWSGVASPPTYPYDVFTLGGDEVWVSCMDRRICKYDPKRLERTP